MRSRFVAGLLGLGFCLWGSAVWAQSPGHTWDQLADVYSFHAPEPMQVTAAEPQDAGQYLSQHIVFTGRNGAQVPALLLTPKGIERPPVILVLHGLGGSKEDVRLLATMLNGEGVALFALDLPLHGERRQEGTDFLTPDISLDGSRLRQAVFDSLWALDYLSSREDLDTRRLGLLGMSLGAMLGSIVAAVDDRVDEACLIVGGGRWDLLFSQSLDPAARFARDIELPTSNLSQLLWYVEPVNFVGHIAPRPLLMINGTTDKIMPRDCAEALYAAAGEPKRIVWYRGGHTAPPGQARVVSGAVKQWVADLRQMAEGTGFSG